MAQASLRHLLLGVAASGLLSGCVAGTGTESGGTEASVASAPIVGGAGREVEAPEVFQTTENALWDGRPSLGGIWVASPEAVDPERVVIVNTVTGASVTGALFRRERDNPGPALQVSSDAAEALGMLAGQPTELKVTALRRKEPEAPVVTEPAPEAEVVEPAAKATPDPAAEATPSPVEPPTEAEAVAAAALAATGAATEPAAEPVEGAADPALATEDTAEPKTRKERRAEAKAKREAEKAAAAEAKAAAEAAAAAAETAAADAASEAPAAVDPAESAVATVETAPLDAAPLDARTPEAATPVAPAAARTIQIALFSKEENANRAVEALSKVDIAAEVRRADRNGAPYWSVIAQGDAAMLTKIRDAGFADAYFLQ